MSEVVNRLNELTNALKQSPEFQAYIQAKAEVEAHEELKIRVFQFKNEQFTVQIDKAAGKSINENYLKGLQHTYSNFMLHPIISKFLQAELQLTKLMSEVYQTIQKEVSIDVSFLK